MPALQNKMQASSTLDFRYFTCLLDRGHIRENVGVIFVRWKLWDGRKNSIIDTEQKEM